MFLSFLMASVIDWDKLDKLKASGSPWTSDCGILSFSERFLIYPFEIVGTGAPVSGQETECLVGGEGKTLVSGEGVSYENDKG